MDPLITNNQKFLAEQFCLGDVQVNKLSYNAVLIIKRWKLIRKIPAPVVADIVHAHTERMMRGNANCGCNAVVALRFQKKSKRLQAGEKGRNSRKQ